MAQHWTIVCAATGEVIEQVITSGTHPRFHGFPWAAGEMVARMTERQGDPETETFDGAAWVMDPAKLDPILHARIDREAGEMRCRFITDVPGQELTYQRKEREAREWLAAETPILADFPFLAAESEAIDADPAAAAAEVIAAADQWAAIGSAIEGARIGAKRAVTAATTREAKEAAAIVDWDSVLPSP